MINREEYLILGIVLLSFGLWFSASSFQGITGFVVQDAAISFTEGYLALCFIIIGIILIFSAARSGIEFSVFEAQRGHMRKRFVRGLEEFSESSTLQADKEPPIDSNHFNLDDLEKYTKMGVYSKEDLKKISDKYSKNFTDAIDRGYVEHIAFKDINSNLNNSNKTIQKDYRKKLARDIRLSRTAERVFKIINPEFKNRNERIKSLKHSSVGRMKEVYNPIRKGSAVYVHFTSKLGVDAIEDEGLRGEQQALYFPNLESAEHFVKSRGKSFSGATYTGASSGNYAVIFQTTEVPDINLLSGKVRPKAIFREGVRKSSIYKLEKYKM